jgi:hypothetical protein
MTTNFKIGDSVIVFDPDIDDLWSHSFQGQVKAFRGEFIVVEDGNGDCFDIEPHQMEPV